MNDGIPSPCVLGLTGERLSIWRDGRLSARERAAITAHLPLCQSCQQYLSQFEVIAQMLRGQRELEPGNRIWQPVQMRINQRATERRFPMNLRSLFSGIGSVAAALFLVSVFVVVLHLRAAGPGITTPPTVVTSPPAATTPSVVSPFKVASIDLAVHPTTVAGIACGTTITVTYTATFHIVANGPGGTIQFMYTANNGRSSSTASVVVAAGQTTATYSYSVTSKLALDHTFPGIGEVIASSPNSVSSPQVYPQGACSPPAFKVTSIGLAVHPASVAGIACGTTITVTYTATFHIVAQSSGGTIQFMYTANNGRSSSSASIAVAAGQTIATYSYAVTGKLALDHTFPGIGEVISSSPNSVSSPQVMPQGTCTSQPFKVASIDLAVHPTSVAGIACGTTITVTYTATFHIVANGPGGTIQFMYTANNGRSSSIASVTVTPGQTTATYSYSVTGRLAPDHTFPGIGEVIASGPNSVSSPQVMPQGACT